MSEENSYITGQVVFVDGGSGAGFACGSDVGGATALRHLPDEQGDDGTDDRADYAGGLEEALVRVLVEEHAAEQPADQRANDGELGGLAVTATVALGNVLVGS